ncbi:MAG: hypothetical protein ACLRQ0_05545 [Monoglobales bacterium]
MDKLLPATFLFIIVIIGFVYKKVELAHNNERLNFTRDYRNKFITYVNSIVSNHTFDQKLYYELTSDVNKMQYELGADGVYAHLTDNLKGYSVKNYQLLINFLPETRNILNDINNIIMQNRYMQSIQSCDDMFIRHIGTLDQLDEQIRKNLYNPFSNFAQGIRFFVSLPWLILNWFGFISIETKRKITGNFIIKLLNFLVTIVGFASNIIAIFVGWEPFLLIIKKLIM